MGDTSVSRPLQRPRYRSGKLCGFGSRQFVVVVLSRWWSAGMHGCSCLHTRMLGERDRFGAAHSALIERGYA